MKIKLVDINKDLVEQWKHAFRGCLDVEAICESIFDHPSDALISPANSFGFMTGGIDGVITNELGPQVQDRVQAKIKSEFDGELLVGQALIVKTGDSKFPYLISAPTMRLPSDISDTVNVYLAAKAIFLMMKKNPHIKSVAIPGLGTATGRVSPRSCAAQMRKAYDDYWLGQYTFPEKMFKVFQNTMHGDGREQIQVSN